MTHWRNPFIKIVQLKNGKGSKMEHEFCNQKQTIPRMSSYNPKIIQLELRDKYIITKRKWEI